MSRKIFWLATAMSFVVIHPVYASPQMIFPSAATFKAHAEVGQGDADVIYVKNDKNKEKGKNNSAKGHGTKQPKAKGGISKDLKKAEKDARKDAKKEAQAQQRAEKEPKRVKLSKDDRLIASQRLMAIAAPQNRDMRALLSAVPLALLGGNTLFQDVPGDRLLTYRNCPPGLAKKDPPCVPPGLAKKGVTYDQWVSYDDKELDRLYQDRRDGYLRAQGIEGRTIDKIDDSGFLLSSDQVAQLYNLQPAPTGQMYALIDGMPVLLEAKNYAALARINDMARVPLLGNGVQVAPAAALTQAELIQAYRLPPLDPGQSYSVVNGEVLALENDAFEVLQLIRIAKAVF